MAPQHLLLNEQTEGNELSEHLPRGHHALLYVVSGQHEAAILKPAKEPVIRLAGHLSLIITPKSQEALILNAGHQDEKHGDHALHGMDKPLHPRFALEVSMDSHRKSLHDFMRHGQHRTRSRNNMD